MNNLTASFVNKFWTEHEKKLFLLGLNTTLQNYSVFKRGERVIGQHDTPIIDLFNHWCRELSCDSQDVLDFQKVRLG